MTTTYDQALAAALELPDDLRLTLVERLLPTIPCDPALDAEQRHEVARRVAEVKSGKVKTIPGELVFATVSASLAGARSK